MAARAALYPPPQLSEIKLAESRQSSKINVLVSRKLVLVNRSFLKLVLVKPGTPGS